MTPFATRSLPVTHDYLAPDGMEVRLLLNLDGGGFAQFRLPPGKVSQGVLHLRVEEIWYFTAGTGDLWRGFEGREEVTPVQPGTCIAIPRGVAFQLRATGPEALCAVAVTMPPWRNDIVEVEPVDGPWEVTVEQVSN